MGDPRVLVALAAEAAGLQSMLSDFIARLDLAGVQPADDSLDRASLELRRLNGSLLEQATGDAPCRS